MDCYQSAGLRFDSNTGLRALAAVYACDDFIEKFVQDFVSARNKVMNLDSFELASCKQSSKNKWRHTSYACRHF
jgi:hypothetical protein